MKKIYLLAPAIVIAFVLWHRSQPKNEPVAKQTTAAKEQTPSPQAKSTALPATAPQADAEGLAQLKAEVERQGFVKVEVGSDENGQPMIKTAQWPTLSPEDLSAKVVAQFKENREQIIENINGGPVEMSADESEVLNEIVAELPESER